eukprot:g47520.t1
MQGYRDRGLYGLLEQVEQFWRFYSHLVRPGDLTGHSDFHLFKDGIKPMWEKKQTWGNLLYEETQFFENIIGKRQYEKGTRERSASDLKTKDQFFYLETPAKCMDEANKNGGKWIIRLRKGLASRCWENLILAMLGEQFMVGEEICGAVVSVRFQKRLGRVLMEIFKIKKGLDRI